ncbi:hypothetical protein DFH09DRAFT_206399 [Mycena vulgaris]|nr:hypothetical protein DFH09DRAFT_206399 [Mycena vulgaris]
MAGESASDDDSKCRIAEILQHSCVPKTNSLGHPFVQCVPIPRLFRMYVLNPICLSLPAFVCSLRCPEKPAVEVTRVVNIDLSTGYVKIPKSLGQILPNGKVWRDVVKFETSSEE